MHRLNRRWINRFVLMARGQSLRSQLLRSGMGVGALKMLSLPLTLLVTILLARTLGPEGFGQYAFVIALITTLSIPLGPALMQLTTRETARVNPVGDHGRIHMLMKWANRHVMLGSIMIIVTVGGITMWVADYHIDDRGTLLLAGLMALPLLGLNAVRAGVLAGLRQVVRGQFPDLFVRPMVLLIVAASLLFAGFLNPLTAVFAYLLGAAMAFVVGIVLLKRTFPGSEGASVSMDAALNRQWLRVWLPFTLLVAASTLNAQIGILLLGWMSTDGQVAAMQVAERGAMLVVLSLTVVNLVIGPHITQVHRSKNRAKLQALSRQSSRMALLVALPIALPLIFIGGPILSLVFGVEYAEIATLPLAILAVGQLINVSFGSVGMLLTMSGYERDTLLGQTIALIVNAVAAVLLIPPLGAVGAALATAIGLLVWNGVLAILVFRRLSIVPSPFSFGEKLAN